jgi:hypothetical protein
MAEYIHEQCVATGVEKSFFYVASYSLKHLQTAKAGALTALNTSNKQKKTACQHWDFL